MLGRELFEGKNIRLSAIEPDRDAGVEALWTQDIGYVRVNYSLRIPCPLNVFQIKKIYEELGKDSSDLNNHIEFAVRSLKSDKLIGFVKLYSIEWTNGSGFFQMGFGDLNTFKQFACETLHLVLAYAFGEINLYCLNIALPAFEELFIKFYEQYGFVQDVRQREAIFADGRYWDKFILSILQDEWTMENTKEIV